MADAGLVSIGATGVIASLEVIRFPALRAIGRGPSGVSGTLNGAPRATVLVETDSVDRPMRSVPASPVEANGDGCRKVNGPPLPG
jgi:hypothetical protein